MKLVSFIKDDREYAGIISRDGSSVCVIPGSEGKKEPMLELLREGLMDRIPELYAYLDAPETEFIPMEQIRLIAPIPHPRNFLCIGLNFQEHARQVAIARGEVYTPNPFPAYFAKRVYECTHNADLPYLPGFEDSYEGAAEIAVVIGKDALDLTKDNVRDYILGYTVHNDACENVINKHYVQPMRAKSLDGMTDLGAWIVTKDEFEPEHVWNIQMYLADKLYAESLSDKMSFDIPYMVCQLSTHTTLEAGTVIASGSPGEIYDRYYPTAGESIKVVVEGIGELEQRLVPAEKPTPYSDKVM